MTTIRRGTARRLGLRHDPWHAYPRRWVLGMSVEEATAEVVEACEALAAAGRIDWRAGTTTIWEKP